MATAREGVQEQLARAAQAVAAALVPDPQARADRLGDIFLACRQVADDQPEAFREALEDGALEEFLTQAVRPHLRGENSQTFSGGWLGTYIEADGRPVADDENDTTDREALELSGRALQRALSIAAAQDNKTLQRNLHWYQQRLAHKSYEAIAQGDGKVAATVRTGVARARKFVLRIVHELQHAQPAPLSGEAPADLEPLRQLWFKQDLETLAHELERTREDNAENPHWLNLTGLLAGDRGRRAEAAQCYERALVYADAPTVRGRVLNNLGNLFDDHDCPEEARQYWARAHQLLPHAPAPLLNLLAGASDRKDYASAQHYIGELSELFNSGRLSAKERDYVCRRLAENPRLAWLRETDAWSPGPARWIRMQRGMERTLRTGVLVTLAAFALSLLLLVPELALAAQAPREQASSPAVWTPLPSNPAALEPVQWAKRKRGGDSMGKPARRMQEGELFAGDSMGRTRPRPGGRKKRRPAS